MVSGGGGGARARMPPSRSGPVNTGNQNNIILEFAYLYLFLFYMNCHILIMHLIVFSIKRIQRRRSAAQDFTDPRLSLRRLLLTCVMFHHLVSSIILYISGMYMYLFYIFIFTEKAINIKTAYSSSFN